MNEEQYAEIRGQLAANDKEHESYNRRLAEHAEHLERLDNTFVLLERLTNSVNALSASIGELKTTVQSMDRRVGEIEREPADKWKKMTWKVVELVLAAIVGAAIAVFLKN